MSTHFEYNLTLQTHFFGLEIYCKYYMYIYIVCIVKLYCTFWSFVYILNMNSLHTLQPQRACTTETASLCQSLIASHQRTREGVDATTAFYLLCIKLLYLSSVG